jgi:hypothetical protein
MGAQSDLIAEQFVPSEEHRARQMAMARQLIASGVDAEEVARMLSIPVGMLVGGGSAG